VIGCLSPAALDFNETLNCLSFLTRIQCISNTPVMNGVTDSSDHERNVEVTSEEQYTDVVDSEGRSTNADTFGYVAMFLCLCYTFKYNHKFQAGCRL
jgi:Kinesin-like protein